MNLSAGSATKTTMHKLATYVASILGYEGAPPILDKIKVQETHEEDQDGRVSYTVMRFHFADGVVIERSIEQDDYPSAQACAECWITYRVLSNGRHLQAIQPSSKSFDTSCREAYWLSYHLS